LIKLLRSVQNDGGHPDTHGVQVGTTSSDPPTLPSILAACVSYSTSDAALRMAIREQLNYAEVIIPILTIIDDWLVELSSHGTGLIPNTIVGENVVVPTRPCSGKVEIPPLDKVSPGLFPNTCVDSECKRYWHFYEQFLMQHS